MVRHFIVGQMAVGWAEGRTVLPFALKIPTEERKSIDCKEPRYTR